MTSVQEAPGVTVSTVKELDVWIYCVTTYLYAEGK